MYVFIIPDVSQMEFPLLTTYAVGLLDFLKVFVPSPNRPLLAGGPACVVLVPRRALHPDLHLEKEDVIMFWTEESVDQSISD